MATVCGLCGREIEGDFDGHLADAHGQNSPPQANTPYQPRRERNGVDFLFTFGFFGAALYAFARSGSFGLAPTSASPDEVVFLTWASLVAVSVGLLFAVFRPIEYVLRLLGRD